MSPLSLALKFKFVTPWTSMIVVKETQNQQQESQHYPTPAIQIKHQQSHQSSSSPNATKIQQLVQAISKRKTNFRRRAPPFSRTLRPTTFTYSATSSARRSRHLLDIEEEDENETDQFIADDLSNMQTSQNVMDLCLMNAAQVCEFITSMGSAYPVHLFKNINGLQLVRLDENDLKQIGIKHKLHRIKILLEIDRRLNRNNSVCKPNKKYL
eukprot:UN03528